MQTPQLKEASNEMLVMVITREGKNTSTWRKRSFSPPTHTAEPMTVEQSYIMFIKTNASAEEHPWRLRLNQVQAK